MTNRLKAPNNPRARLAVRARARRSPRSHPSARSLRSREEVAWEPRRFAMDRGQEFQAPFSARPICSRMTIRSEWRANCPIRAAARPRRHRAQRSGGNVAGDDLLPGPGERLAQPFPPPPRSPPSEQRRCSAPARLQSIARSAPPPATQVTLRHGCYIVAAFVPSSPNRLPEFTGDHSCLELP